MEEQRQRACSDFAGEAASLRYQVFYCGTLMSRKEGALWGEVVLASPRTE